MQFSRAKRDFDLICFSSQDGLPSEVKLLLDFNGEEMVFQGNLYQSGVKFMAELPYFLTQDVCTENSKTHSAQNLALRF